MIREMTVDHFDSDKLDLFFRFLTERQRIWVRRAHLQMPRPWTTDRTMNYEFITNVYRELDPGTSYVLDTIAAGGLSANVCFNIMLYRLMASNVVSFDAIGKQQISRFTAKRFTRKVEETGLQNVFGDAYRVAGYERGELGNTKVHNVGKIFEDIAGNMEEWWRRLVSSSNARQIYQVFNSIEGFGVFLSNQLMVDLLMVSESLSEPIWHFGTDDWCEAGPGAKRGIKQLLAPGVKVANNQIVMAWLRDWQVDMFHQRQLTFPFLLDRNDEIKRLSLCNIQTSLCEFHKYVRGRNRVKVRAYSSTPSLLEPFDVVINADEIENLRNINACTPTDDPIPVNRQITSIDDINEPDEVETVSEPVQTAPGGVTTAGLVEVEPGVPILPLASFSETQNVQQGLQIAHILGLAAQNQQNRMAPVTIPVDPNGLLGLPKAIVIVPIY